MPRRPSIGASRSYYDVFAPKFVYVRKVGNLTRKTQRYVKGQELVLGQPSQPSFEKKKGSMYPATRPMMNYERIYVGMGRRIGRGRTKQSKPKGFFQTKKPFKRGFRKYVSTYKS